MSRPTWTVIAQVVEITACKGGTFSPSVSGCIISQTCGNCKQLFATVVQPADDLPRSS